MRTGGPEMGFGAGAIGGGGGGGGGASAWNPFPEDKISILSGYGPLLLWCETSEILGAGNLMTESGEFEFELLGLEFNGGDVLLLEVE